MAKHYFMAKPNMASPIREVTLEKGDKLWIISSSKQELIDKSLEEIEQRYSKLMGATQRGTKEWETNYYWFSLAHELLGLRNSVHYKKQKLEDASAKLIDTLGQLKSGELDQMIKYGGATVFEER